jgi:hypothetical protein
MILLRVHAPESNETLSMDWRIAIFAKAFLGNHCQQAVKNSQPLCPRLP